MWPSNKQIRLSGLPMLGSQAANEWARLPSAVACRGKSTLCLSSTNK